MFLDLRNCSSNSSPGIRNTSMCLSDDSPKIRYLVRPSNVTVKSRDLLGSSCHEGRLIATAHSSFGRATNNKFAPSLLESRPAPQAFGRPSESKRILAFHPPI